ncbi:MAG: hypothetical protein EHM24_30985 [Acidobacteria bacterium]|nr:MAG: hypothetical protein EHM24_30985 [Acidobacteriota bacterium]
MIDGFRVFATHAHLGIARHSGRRYSAEEMLRDMDRAGVDRTLAIPFPVVDDYRAAHDEIGGAVRAHPDRLVGAACLNPFIPEAAFLSEVRRCAEEYGFRALKLQPQYQALDPLSSRSEFLFDAARSNGLAVICHTGSGVPFALPSLFMAPARKFPDVSFVLAHCGGSVYYGEAIVAASFCPNIFLELSSLMPHHILHVLQHVPASRLMIGSDLPESVEIEVGKIVRLPIPREDRAQILSATADSVFVHKAFNPGATP